MENNALAPICVSGNPNENELAAIVAAYSSYLSSLGNNVGQLELESANPWIRANSRKFHDKTVVSARYNDWILAKRLKNRG